MVKGVIFNFLYLIYVGSCYHKPCLYRQTSCLYRSKLSFPSRTQKCFYVYYICNCNQQ